MRKKYEAKYLIVAIVFIVLQVAAFVIQRSFGQTNLTGAYGVDFLFFLVISFLLIIQPKSFEKPFSIAVVVYASFNLLYAITADSIITLFTVSLEYEVLALLSMLLGYVLLIISSLILLVHHTQQRFSSDFTKKFLIILLSFSFMFLLLTSFLISNSFLISIIKLISVLLTFITLYVSMILTINEKTDEDKQLEREEKIKNLQNLLNRNIISSKEYEIRIAKL